MTLASSHAMRIQICGQVAIECDGHRLEAGLPGRQGRLLFTYLIVNRHRQVPRDELAEALWREPDPAAVDTRLSPLLSKLRRVFGADAVDGRSVLRLRLPDAWVDLEAAAEAIHRATSPRPCTSQATCTTTAGHSGPPPNYAGSSPLPGPVTAG